MDERRDDDRTENPETGLNETLASPTQAATGQEADRKAEREAQREATVEANRDTGKTESLGSTPTT